VPLCDTKRDGAQLYDDDIIMVMIKRTWNVKAKVALLVQVEAHHFHSENFYTTSRVNKRWTFGNSTHLEEDLKAAFQK
jgi:hypothetical protein